MKSPEGQIVELCCAHDEFYQKKLTKLKAVMEHVDIELKYGCAYAGHREFVVNLIKAVKEVLKDE